MNTRTIIVCILIKAFTSLAFHAAPMKMSSKTPSVVVATGANGGIGKSFCEHYSQQGSKVIAVCRSGEDIKKMNLPNTEIIEGIDVTCDASVKKLADFLEQSDLKVDILINNAGSAARGDSLDEIVYNDAVKAFEVNAVGPLRVTKQLYDRRLLTSPGCKVGLITSRMGSMKDNTSGGRYAYRMSKAALNAAGVSLAFDLKPLGVSVAILHPGWVRTAMTNFDGLISPKESVSGMVKILEDELDLNTSGTWWHTNGEVLQW
uniref:Short-chain dehydrogenase n=1 Tax=Fibrocapsa japonica TaxID=94617 RepID=A0A7S2V6A8_9STRA|eukprot:CAMPEP_0113949982 /NCGR_PEP_ID=MMETSP1339-20121228/78569_1 /TAXON_ID=94617 /ORGANISM="Fibrocapsa japonica" /LENGTH=260 /DNA_ID=CAMNT_0000957643 /DNA_START=11 /DNA_END=793 /DNA_ORIENTATION=- /assembly_acc=CAM_ASM_000762